MATPGLIIAAPSSGSGKTLITLGLLSHLAGRGIAVASAKVGPDYIDPAFHAAATGRACPNLDGWALRPHRLAALTESLSAQSDLIVCEGVMGLFDGAEVPADQSNGSTAQVAALTGWPVILVIDGRGMTESAAALLAGFAAHRPDVPIAGVIFNKVAGDKHKRMILAACAKTCPQVEVLGFIPPLPDLVVPSRHLGLIQACEHPDLPGFLAAAAHMVAEHLNISRLIALARPSVVTAPQGPLLPPLGQRIAVARDHAFAFAYPTILDGWRNSGAEINFFSPLADEAPDGDAVYLPGGYPELHAATLARNDRFLLGLRQAAQAEKPIFGECGGYMVLGQALTDAQGETHAMAGLLPLKTSFARRRLHLGYRQACLLHDTPLGKAGSSFRAHEFHYATIDTEQGQSLFQVADAMGHSLGQTGLHQGSVFASFIHLIDACA